MKTYEFSIIASGLDHEAADFEQRFLDAGCDDATLTIQKGRIVIYFDRDAESMEAAVDSALAAVEAAGAVAERVEPDPLVTLSDIAERAGLTRQAVSQYASGVRGETFPGPVARVTSQRPLWDWVDVAHWLVSRGLLTVDDAQEAEVIRRANEQLADRHSAQLVAAV